MIGPGVGESRSGRISCSFYLYFGTLGYFTFGITNLSLQCGSVLSQWNCKFKIAWNCFPIIFLRLPSPKKVAALRCIWNQRKKDLQDIFAVSIILQLEINLVLILALLVSSDFISHALPVLTSDFNHELTQPEKCMSCLVLLGNFSINQ